MKKKQIEVVKLPTETVRRRQAGIRRGVWKMARLTLGDLTHELSSLDDGVSLEVLGLLVLAKARLVRAEASETAREVRRGR